MGWLILEVLKCFLMYGYDLSVKVFCLTYGYDLRESLVSCKISDQNTHTKGEDRERCTCDCSDFQEQLPRSCRLSEFKL